jgi:hypothetical protein
MAVMQRTVQELKTTVGRAQALARQVSASNDGAEALTQLRQQNLATVELFSTLVDGIDASALDPALRQRVKEARDEIMEAERRAQMLDELREELGISPTAVQDRDAVNAVQESANALAEEIEDQIVAAGLDPDDAALFPWQQWAGLFKDEGPRAVRRAALKAINDAKDADQSGDRREQRRAAAGKTPKGNAGGPAKDPLTTGDLDARVAALKALTRG